MLDKTAGMGQATGQTAMLAEFVAGVKRSGVPAPVRTILQQALVDAIGCGLFGLTTRACRIVHDFALEQAGPAETTLWTSNGSRISAANAALAMGTAIHGFDFDDHHRAKIHPGAAVLPAVLALGEREGADGATLLAALAAGYETMCRVSLAANPNSSRMRGWHLTGTAGTFGAAAAAAVILGFDARTTASALGLAGTQSAGLWAFNADGAMSKRLHPGRAAQAGIVAALLAARGFHGPRFILEAEDGGFLAATSDDVRLDEIGRELGTEWRTEKVCFKPYSCCGSNHAAVDATIDLARENGLGPDDIERIIIGISRVVERQTGFVYHPSTTLNAQMSIRYNIAVALTDGTALVDQFAERRLADPQLLDIIDRMEVEIDPEMDAVYPQRYAGIVTMKLRNGQTVRERVDFSKGMPENPMSGDDIRAKFRSLASTAVGPDEAETVLTDLEGLFDGKGVAALAKRLGSERILVELDSGA